jgi:hypothetical protein
MNRKKWRIIAVSLMILALILGMQSVVLAKSRKVRVTGNCSMGWVDPGRQWWDNGGHLHVVNARAVGDFTLDSVDDPSFPVDGELTVILSCIADPLSGPCHGSITFRDGPDGTVLWEGRIHLTNVNMMTSGHVVAHGRGPYEGTQLKLDWQERDDLGPNPDVFALSGCLLYPHG